MGHGERISWGRLILGGLLGLLVAAALVALIGPLIAAQVSGGSNFRIRSEAMAPTLSPGDWVLAEPLFPGAVPARGTIVAYDNPRNRGGNSILRVVGLPGENVQMRGGALYINSVRADMERLDDRVIARKRQGPGRPLCVNDPAGNGGECRQERWRETLPDGTSQIVLNTRKKIGVAVPANRDNLNDTVNYRVPMDEVFLLGDNRDGAIDSRFAAHGTVPVHKLRYKVWMIHTSLDNTARFLSPRWDRFFREVH